MLGKVVYEKQRDWDAHVAYVMTAYNATVHNATGFTPNRLVYGRELRFPNELMYQDVEDVDMDEPGYPEFVIKQGEAFKRYFFLVRETLGLTAERSKKRYDMRVRAALFKAGDWVYYFCPRHRVGRSPK